MSNVDANDHFSELNVFQMILLNVLMLEFRILEFVKATDFYANVSIPYRILLTMSMTIAYVEEKKVKVKLIEKLLEFNKITRKIERYDRTY
ncbi:hypothetical protein MTR_7g006410 [Medicago truncatula]|uniref:Uncharacterized protein n=1 Tax=Medicago truncatula TaxID=3880 RepID=A2Q4Y6_MEDTR|nr:hypothetical protein MtrDRAFT_AC157893g24v2 [Medicago truncatula]AES77255.1 hypothetical protein MTR_7g006410 [Medicago truncatula]